ncbi:cryptochrome/DNA photolyase family protein [Urbifossiella limnaea]|uniref:Deoxyribodipyrimidine photo-lyase n=1 Tax=Urbifossiella limnaea TaxID=2528023 RepID=A0A517XZ77_9BACT|nr:deoxyribodipyrimidine photolyase [Urbifossiella limnaea]QDU22815.1 FAD binding domain of DNA photolyase [Urbifossiella limnaea]
MTTYNDARVRAANSRPANPAGRYVLLWLQTTRRLHSSHALDYALHLCRHYKKPLVVYEGLKLGYPWANARNHTFMLEGTRDTAADAARLGVAHWPFVETPDQPGRGLVVRLATDSCAVVTDDSPCFVVPAHNRAVAAKSPVAVYLVDGNGVAPLKLLGDKPVSAAAHLRPRIHAQFPEAWANRAAAEPDVPKVAKSQLAPPFEPWRVPKDMAAFVRQLPIDQTVPPVPGVVGGTVAGRAVLAEFVAKKLPRYAEGRNQPDDPARGAASRLSPYLRFGHVAIEDVIDAVFGTLGDWSPAEINPTAKGKRDDFYSRDASVNGFLDEAITWRDVGRQFFFAGAGTVVPHSADSTPPFPDVLPAWAQETLRKHAGDRREHLYTPEQFEAADTHDPLWNAAQTELVRTGRMHNYLRMLWGKKVLEWSETPAEAYRVLEHLNNKYALDGRDPNSYTGILWCFGLFDRPWPPERPVFGNVRYMSSENTARKFKLAGYHEYVRGLTGPAATLF